MKMTLCPYCMKEVADEMCPYCGNSTAYIGKPAHLPCGYVLQGTHPYILGAALGQGGFGITYIALDMVTNERVAVKEYYPTYCAVRTDQQIVTSYAGQEAVFDKGKDRFLDEARVLKSLSDLTSIVNVLDFFEFNNSAYLVMEFLEGDSLKSHAQKHGKFPAQEFLAKLHPLMEDIERMHQRGVVHRDIAPDNIILTPDGQMKLIDFGAARSYVGDKSMTVVVKKGFAPIEQYMRHGSTAATDVYALAATIYYCITGVVPPDSAERQYDEDMLKTPISLGAELSREQERAILKALEVQPKKRTQSVAELLKTLEHAPKPEKPKPVKKEIKTEPKKKAKWVIPAVAAVILCIVGAVLFTGKESAVAPSQTEPQQMEVPETTIPETEPPVILSEEAQKYNEAVDFFNNGEYGKAAIAFGKLGDYRDSKEISLKIWDAMTTENTLSAKSHVTVGLKTNGTVVAIGLDNYGICDGVSYWTDIAAISTGWNHTVGLAEDGTVVAVGNNKDGQCNVSEWTNITAISAGYFHTVGLKADGTVLAVGYNENGQCNVSKWRDIVAVSAGDAYTVGLKADGSVVAVGVNSYGRFDGVKWWDIVAVSAENNKTIGIKANGTAVAVGESSYGQCNLSNWTDMISISAGSFHTVGLKVDGTAVAVGNNQNGQCNISEWMDMVAIYAGYLHTVGMKEDGTVVATGDNSYGQCNVSDWKDIRLPADRDALLAAIELSYITEE